MGWWLGPPGFLRSRLLARRRCCRRSSGACPRLWRMPTPSVRPELSFEAGVDTPARGSVAPRRGARVPGGSGSAAPKRRWQQSPGRRRRTRNRRGRGERCPSEELGTDQPRVSVIRLATRAFVRAAGWLGEQGRWLIALGVGGVAAGVGKKLGEDHAEQILTHLVAMNSKLTAIVTPIAHFFASMHLPF